MNSVCRLEEEVEGRAVDASGNVYMTVEELMKQEAEQRAGESAAALHCAAPFSSTAARRSRAEHA